MPAATDNFSSFGPALSTPANNAAAVTPDDNNDLGNVTRSVYVGGTGALAVIMAGGQSVTFSAVQVGTVLPIRVSRIKSTGTTAANIIALW